MPISSDTLQMVKMIVGLNLVCAQLHGHVLPIRRCTKCGRVLFSSRQPSCSCSCYGTASAPVLTTGSTPAHGADVLCSCTSNKQGGIGTLGSNADMTRSSRSSTAGRSRHTAPHSDHSSTGGGVSGHFVYAPLAHTHMVSKCSAARDVPSTSQRTWTLSGPQLVTSAT